MTKLETGDKVVRKVVSPTMKHGYNPELVVTLLPNACVEIRELRTRTETPVILDLAELYVRSKIAAAMPPRAKGR